VIWVQLLIGLVVLIVGAEILVRGGSRLAAVMGISPLVIGMTVVAFGTGAPEIATALQAGQAGQLDLAVGNIVGSNISNVLLILGIAALVAPLVVMQRLVKREVPLMVLVSLMVWLLSLDGGIGQPEGAILLLGGIAYTGFVIYQSRKESQEVIDEYAQEYGAEPPVNSPNRYRLLMINALFVVAGLACLVVGSRWLVDSAVEIAGLLGLSETIIGLTIVSVGTSMPELATSAIASRRGEGDIAVGNVVGSNLFNLLVVLGLTAAAMPAGLPVSEAVRNFDLPVMVAVAFACLPVFYVGYRISRWEGALFVGYYAVYIAYLLLESTQHDALPAFSAIMLQFVIPLTVITLIILVGRFFWVERSTSPG
jgi:cation:H+ antiporter